MLLFLDALDPQKLQEIPTGPSVLRPRLTTSSSAAVWNGSSSHIFALQAFSSTPQVPMETQVHTHLYSSLFMDLLWSWLGHWVIILHLVRIQQGINNPELQLALRVGWDKNLQGWAPSFPLPSTRKLQIHSLAGKPWRIPDFLNQNWNQNCFHQAASN